MILGSPSLRTAWVEGPVVAWELREPTVDERRPGLRRVVQRVLVRRSGSVPDRRAPLQILTAVRSNPASWWPNFFAGSGLCYRSGVGSDSASNAPSRPIGRSSSGFSGRAHRPRSTPSVSASHFISRDLRVVHIGPSSNRIVESASPAPPTHRLQTALATRPRIASESPAPIPPFPYRRPRRCHRASCPDSATAAHRDPADTPMPPWRRHCPPRHCSHRPARRSAPLPRTHPSRPTNRSRLRCPAPLGAALPPCHRGLLAAHDFAGISCGSLRRSPRDPTGPQQVSTADHDS